VFTDARFSGLSAGACIGHASPEALAGGPIGKLRDGDLVEIVIDREKLKGSVNRVGEDGRTFSPEEGAVCWLSGPSRATLRPILRCLMKH
jgi:dihydroxyacid dehydratase/phosphogluconate dehydratase